MPGIRGYGAIDENLMARVIASQGSVKVQSHSINGNNPQTGTAAIEDVWDVGGRYPYLEDGVASIINVASTSADDAAAGTGIQRIRLAGMNADYEITSEFIVLNGITPVPTTQEYIRVFKLTNETLSTTPNDRVAAGDITATTVTGTLTQARIPTGQVASHNSIFTIPAGYTGFLDQAFTSGGPTDDFVIFLSTRPLGGTFVHGSETEISNSSFSSEVFNPPFGMIPEKHDIKASTQAVTQNARSRIAYTITLIRNDFLDSLADSI